MIHLNLPWQALCFHVEALVVLGILLSVVRIDLDHLQLILENAQKALRHFQEEVSVIHPELVLLLTRLN